MDWVSYHMESPLPSFSESHQLPATPLPRNLHNNGPQPWLHFRIICEALKNIDPQD